MGSLDLFNIERRTPVREASPDNHMVNVPIMPDEDNSEEMEEALEELIDDLNWILAEEQAGQDCPPDIQKQAQLVCDYVRARIDANPDAEAKIVKDIGEDYSIVEHLGIEDMSDEEQAIIAGAFIDIAIKDVKKADGDTGVMWSGPVGRNLR